MSVDMTDPFVSSSIVVVGSLVVSVVGGTINGCLSKGPKATFCMRVGDYVLAALFWFSPSPENRISHAFLDSSANGRFTFWSRVFDSIGGCWVVTFILGVIVYGVCIFFFA